MSQETHSQLDQLMRLAEKQRTAITQFDGPLVLSTSVAIVEAMNRLQAMSLCKADVASLKKLREQCRLNLSLMSHSRAAAKTLLGGFSDATYSRRDVIQTNHSVGDVVNRL